MKHATAAVGSDSGDDKISKDAWDESHITPGLETITLDATYGDDFNGVALDAKWTRVNITSGEETFADGYLDIAFGTGTGARSYYQTPSSMPTNMELILGPIESQELVANQFMFGLYFVDNTGAGVGWSLYYDGNGYLWNLAWVCLQLHEQRPRWSRRDAVPGWAAVLPPVAQGRDQLLRLDELWHPSVVG
jgi:hypothetical protein